MFPNSFKHTTHVFMIKWNKEVHYHEETKFHIHQKWVSH